MNHTHYLMLDDATCRDVNTEQYRTRLCSQIMKSNSHGMNEFDRK